MKLMQKFATLLLAAIVFTGPACAAGRQPKFGPYAVPLFQQTDFFRSANSSAKDYWKLSQFYLPQQTSSACSLASAAMAVNFLRGIPKFSDQTLITQNELLQTVFTGNWGDKVAEGGDGVTFDELVQVVRRSLRQYGRNDYTVEIIRPSDDGAASLAMIRQALSANERSGNDLIVAYFNQGVLTSDWDGPHVSPIGAYDEGRRSVLIMDVDRDWYPPYWSSDAKLLEALLRPAPPEQFPLDGQVGGLLWIKKAR